MSERKLFARLRVERASQERAGSGWAMTVPAGESERGSSLRMLAMFVALYGRDFHGREAAKEQEGGYLEF